MALLSLPNELLGRIVKETMPMGFENLMLSCKAIYLVGKIYLMEHNTLRERYRHFKYTGNCNPADKSACGSALQLISHIADDPRIAQYMVSADLKDDTSLYSHPDFQGNMKVLADSLTDCPQLRALLEQSDYLQDIGHNAEDVLHHFMQQQVLEEGDHTFAAALLLSLLPNVTEITLPQRWEKWNMYANEPSIFPDTSTLLDVIVNRANDPAVLGAGLSNLASILPSTAWGYRNRWALSSFTPFLSIKSMRKICAASTLAIDDGYTGAAFNIPQIETFGSGIEVVELVGAAVDGKEMRKFLSKMPRLKVFRLSYETKWHGCGHDLNAAALAENIAHAVGDRLEQLSLSVLACYGCIDTIVSMKNFKKLEILELDMELIMGTLSNKALHDGEDESFLGKIPLLSDICPSSLKTLHILAPRINDYPYEMGRFLSESVADTRKKLPNLEYISIRFSHQDVETDSRTGQDLAFKKKMNFEERRDEFGALHPPITVELVEVNPDVALAEFMRGFLTRYNVEIETG